MGRTTATGWLSAMIKAADACLSPAYARQTRPAAVVVVRLFNTIGPRQTGQYGMVVPPRVRQALRRMIAARRDESSARADD